MLTHRYTRSSLVYKQLQQLRETILIGLSWPLHLVSNLIDRLGKKCLKIRGELPFEESTKWITQNSAETGHFHLKPPFSSTTSFSRNVSVAIIEMCTLSRWWIRFFNQNSKSVWLKGVHSKITSHGRRIFSGENSYTYDGQNRFKWWRCVSNSFLIFGQTV